MGIANQLAFVRRANLDRFRKLLKETTDENEQRLFRGLIADQKITQQLKKLVSSK